MGDTFALNLGIKLKFTETTIFSILSQYLIYFIIKLTRNLITK